MKAFLCILATFITSTALAYKDGTYNCKYGDTSLPDRVIHIETVSLAGGSAEVPYIEVTQYYRDTANSPLKMAQIKGLASSSKSGDTEILMIAALKFEFLKDELLNCRK